MFCLSLTQKYPSTEAHRLRCDRSSTKAWRKTSEQAARGMFRHMVITATHCPVRVACCPPRTLPVPPPGGTGAEPRPCSSKAVNINCSNPVRA